MMQTFNKKETKPTRIALRKNQTDAERVMWSKLRNKQVKGLKFFRQYGIGKYIADFYCPKTKLVIEIDGGGHYTEEASRYDSFRTEAFAALGITTIRFSNHEVLTNLNGVLEQIMELTPPTPSLKKRGNKRNYRFLNFGDTDPKIL